MIMEIPSINHFNKSKYKNESVFNLRSFENEKKIKTIIKLLQSIIVKINHFKNMIHYNNKHSRQIFGKTEQEQKKIIGISIIES